MGHWLVGNLAALIGRGRLLHAGVAGALVALVRLPRHSADPRQAWPPLARANLPGPVAYWAAAAIVIAAVLVAGWWLAGRVERRRHQPVDQRRRLGVAAQARLASMRDLRPLLTRRPEPGRFVLARWRRRYLSTEAQVYRRRRGVAGAVAVIGPSQSGKTTGLMAGLQSWQGPAIVSSVKADLLRATLAVRRRCRRGQGL